ncbi:MAG: hypothetical protein II849_06025 [Bacteroidales bacterium]|nr:hypothetical protein [Bacteroidales bacterium]
MEKEQKRHYEAPQLTVVEFKTEMGFAASGGLTATRRSYGDNDGQGVDNNQEWF